RGLPLERAAVRVDQLARERQAEPDAVGLRGREGCEEAVADGWRHARTAVTDADAYAAVAGRRLDVDPRPGRRYVDRVVEQVPDRLLHLVLVERGDDTGGRIQRQLDAPRLGARRALRDALREQCVERMRIHVQRAIRAEAQQLLDDAVRLLDAGEDTRGVLAHDPAVRVRAREQVGVHADGAVMPAHLVKDRRRGLSDGGEALAAIQLALHGDELLAASLALEPGVVQPLQDRVQGQRRETGDR